MRVFRETQNGAVFVKTKVDFGRAVAVMTTSFVPTKINLLITLRSDIQVLTTSQKNNRPQQEKSVGLFKSNPMAF